MTTARVIQTEHRVVSDGVPKARVIQTEHRVVSDGVPKAIVIQTEHRVVSTVAEVPSGGLVHPVIVICM